MNLLIDIGNTRMKWCLQKEGDLEGTDSARLDSGKILTGLDAHWNKLSRPERVLVANVAGKAIATTLQQWMQGQWDLVPEFVVPQARAFGVINAYMEPLQLGVDRWAALVSARNRYSGAVCIVDCGTALTIDVLNQNGEHLGGLIIPGSKMMRDSLLQHTNIKLENEKEGNVSLLARDTGDAIKGGTLYTIIAVIDRVVADVSAELGIEITRVLTGGDGQKLLPLLAGEYEYEPELVLYGLAIIAGGIANDNIVEAN